MTAKPPLLVLMLGNLDDAVFLGLIDGSSGDVGSFRSHVEAGWPASKNEEDQLTHFDQMMTEARSRLDVVHRPVRNTRQRIRAIATVMSFERFAKRFEDEIAAPKDSVVLKSLLDESATSVHGLNEAERACMEFTAKFGSVTGSSPGKRIRATAVGIGAGRHTWIASPPGRGVTRKAQYWRDRLGLIHLRGQADPLIKHALVRAEFLVEPTRDRLARTDWKGSLKRSPAGIWVIRPTMVHEGNQRFVQSHGGDTSKRARSCLHGMTRDLGSKTFVPGEREMLLICGADAQVRFSSVTLLDGLPGEIAGRDNSDVQFVSQIALERGWP
jgi:hypothetical protein